MSARVSARCRRWALARHFSRSRLWASLGLTAIAVVESPAALGGHDYSRDDDGGTKLLLTDSARSVEALYIKAGFNEPDCSTLPVSGTATIVVPAGCYRVSAAVQFPELSGTEVIEGAGPGPADCSGGGTVIEQQAGQRKSCSSTAVPTRPVSGLTLTGRPSGVHERR